MILPFLNLDTRRSQAFPLGVLILLDDGKRRREVVERLYHPPPLPTHVVPSDPLESSLPAPHSLVDPLKKASQRSFGISRSLRCLLAGLKAYASSRVAVESLKKEPSIRAFPSLLFL